MLDQEPTRAELVHKIDGIEKRLDKIDEAHQQDHDILVGVRTSLDGILEILKRHEAKLDSLNDVDKKLASHGLHSGTEDANRYWMAFGRIMLNWKPISLIIAAMGIIFAFITGQGSIK